LKKLSEELRTPLTSSEPEHSQGLLNQAIRDSIANRSASIIVRMI